MAALLAALDWQMPVRDKTLAHPSTALRAAVVVVGLLLSIRERPPEAERQAQEAPSALAEARLAATRMATPDKAPLPTAIRLQAVAGAAVAGATTLRRVDQAVVAVSVAAAEAEAEAALRRAAKVAMAVMDARSSGNSDRRARADGTRCRSTSRPGRISDDSDVRG